MSKFLKINLNVIKERISANVLEVHNVFHLVLLMYHGLFIEHSATWIEKGLLYTSASRNQEKVMD